MTVSPCGFSEGHGHRRMTMTDSYRSEGEDEGDMRGGGVGGRGP